MHKCRCLVQKHLQPVRACGSAYVHVRLPGQFVPWAGSGSPVRVSTASHTLMVSGVYHLETDD